MLKTLVVIDAPAADLVMDAAEIISFDTYLSDYPKLGQAKRRVLNLCDTEHYLSKGYYCSLLAEARQHKVLPSVQTINELRQTSQDADWWIDLPAAIMSSIEITADPIEFSVFVGRSVEPKWARLARHLFERFAAPLLRVSINVGPNLRVRVARMGLNDVSADERDFFEDALSHYVSEGWRKPVAARKYRWDLAILVDPNEPLPPSDKEAIKRFGKAAGKLGINSELISHNDMTRLTQFDALFIRETTAIDHPTYRMASLAEREGLVVMDDPKSILRCCNKVFLHDAFAYSQVPSLKTKVVADASEETLEMLEGMFGYPMVIKLPESSFSLGVFKVDSRETLVQRLKDLLTNTALVLVQEFCFTEFDWRIGVLNGKPIYACRYHMARKHWQIYNHGAARSKSGGFDAMPTFEVPTKVLAAAVKACAVVGNGLYGVDLKQRGESVYVIEVNDNPSIDHGVENRYLGDELYMIVMSEFAARLETRGR